MGAKSELKSSAKSTEGNFFEDFSLGQEIVHATPRTLTAGDAAVYMALYGSRFALQSSDEFARAVGFKAAPLDDLLVFHTVFGATVADVSVNAQANLGYAAGVFGVPVYAGDTLAASSKVIGLKENRDNTTGIVYVRSRGRNQRREMVIDYVRWVMVPKRDPHTPAAGAPVPAAVVPDLPAAVEADALAVPVGFHGGGYDAGAAGSAHLWDAYDVGERIDHRDGITIEEADHMAAARLYQNSARVHFNQHAERNGRFGRRVVYGGHVISIARALSFNGLANTFRIAAINGGRHVAPSFAGDTVYAWSEVLAKTKVPGRNDVGALRLRTVAVKDERVGDFPGRGADGAYDPAVVLDFDYWALMPRRAAKK
jgi:2-methylfumaryl-CoA hydratase